MQRKTHSSLVAFVLLAGCVGTDVGNPPDDSRTTTVSLTFATFDDTESAPQALHLSNGSIVEEAWFSVTSASLMRCDSEEVLTVEGPFAVELTSGQITPGPILFEDVVPGAFCRVRVRLGAAKVLPENVSPSLVGHALYVAGAAPNDVHYVFADDRPRTLSYRGGEMLVDAEGSNELVAAFEASSWLDDVEVPAPSSSDDSSTIDLAANPGSNATFSKNFDQSSRIVRDVNEDRRVDRDEFENPAAEFENENVERGREEVDVP